MATSANTLILEVAELLFDPGYERWDRDFHIESINEAERRATIFKPDVYVIQKVWQLGEGTYQQIPLDCVQLHQITRNMGLVDGTEPGDAITMVSKKDMDLFRPDWHSQDYADATVQHYMIDERDPLKFWVYPPQPEVGHMWIEAFFCADPSRYSEIEEVTDNINLNDIYQDTIKDYMLFRAHSLDAAHSEFSAARALHYWNLFVSSLDRKDLMERVYTPKIINGNSNQPIR